jgi:hypothetical protein
MTTDTPVLADAVPIHRRSVEFEAFDEGESIVVVGRLRDSRPWAESESAVRTVHDMELRVTVRVDDMTITEASAVMRTFPHVECPGITESFAGLAGLSVTRGYTRAVQTRFGGPRGCTHLEQLARSLGPVVVQAVTSRRARAGTLGLQEAGAGAGSPWARDSCHVWAEDGVADQKLAAGWRPGIGPYPAPAAVTFRASGPTP